MITPLFQRCVQIMKNQDLISKAYAAFNARDIDAALTTMHPEVQWPKAFEGGYVSGHNEIRNYWTRQWAEINPTVEPTGFTERPDGTLEIAVHQIVKDLQGAVLFDGTVKHIYTVQEGLLRRMDIELV
ncbi:nuclear transport factor 2 family protein [Hymenobacter guriensis]|nr:nuclear transport factor 2 family protein [Hymenobacter guriensis]